VFIQDLTKKTSCKRAKCAANCLLADPKDLLRNETAIRH